MEHLCSLANLPRRCRSSLHGASGAHPDLSATIQHRYHDLRAGGATACFALEVPEPHIPAWGGWSARGGAFWKYIGVDRQPTEGDFRVFGWMTLRAQDLHARFAHIFLP